MKRYLLDFCKIVDQAVCRQKYTFPMMQNAPRPEGDYASAKLLKIVPLGVDYEDVVKSGVTVKRVVRGMRELVFYVLFSRTEDEYMLFHSAFDRQDVKDACNKYGLGFQSIEVAELESTTLETDWESRRGFKVTFNVGLAIDVPTCDTSQGDYIAGTIITGTKIDGYTQTEIVADINIKEPK